MDACGEDLLCFDWSDTNDFTTRRSLSRCPPCSCEESCFQTRNCCPDKFFQRPLAFFDSPYLFIADTNIIDYLPKYEIISTCPDVSDRDDMTVCEKYKDEFQFSRPVTSLATNFSYRNIFCAYCHGEKETDLITWNLALEGTIVHFINFIETDTQLLYFAKLFQTSILFSLPTKFQNSVKPLSEDSDEVLNGILPGQCMDDIDLQTACLSSYFNTFRLHRNIFCYICKMNNIKKNNPVIDSCVNPINDSFQKCLKRSESNITYPYKNVYCYTCNVPPTLQQTLQQDPCKTQECRHNITFYHHFVEFSSKIKEEFRSNSYYLRFQKISFNNNHLLQFIQRAITVKNTGTYLKSDQVVWKNLRDELRTFASKNPNRICNQHILPGVLQNDNDARQCDCSYSCLFVGKCTCCVDTALMHPVECINSNHFALSKDREEKEYQIAVVSSCYNYNGEMNFSSEYDKIRHLCKINPAGFDILIWSNNVTYKNIFCFLCNTDFTVNKDVLEYSSFEPMTFTIACSFQLNIAYAIYFDQVIQEAKSQDCDVIFDAHKSIVCQRYDETNISNCPQNVINHPYKRLCENSSVNSFFPVGRYKNEFCYYCNSVEINENKASVTDCATSRGMEQERECPPIQARNLGHSLLCPECVGEARLLKNLTIHDCRPVFGSKLFFSSHLMRELFSPSWTFHEVLPTQAENKVLIYWVYL